jgi:hypothetical protein
MLLQTNEKARAVFFFDQSEIVGQLLFPEFESMLDGFVPAKEWALRTMHGAYVEINHRLCVTSVVFFLIGFDDHGWVDGSWNMPLAELARRGQAGPDLGAGPIRMACTSQSPMPLFSHMLWEPEMKGRTNPLGLLRKAVSHNRLGVCFVDDGSTPPPAPAHNPNDDLVSAMEERMQSVLSQHLNDKRDNGLKDVLQKVMDEQARIPTLVPSTEDHKEHIALLEQALADRDAKLRQMEDLQAELDTQISLSREKYEAQQKKTEGLRDYYEHKLGRLQQEQSALAAQSGLGEKDLEAAVAEATQEFAEILQRKEIELMYRSEREEQLLQQLKRLQDEVASLRNDTTVDYLQNMVKAGLSFISFQPGANALQVKLEELDSFMASPSAFVARSLGVSEVVYKIWLAHYTVPVCSAQDADGPCNTSVARVDDPKSFVLGSSDRCPKHRTGR